MKRKNKRVLKCLFILVFVVSLCGCQDTHTPKNIVESSSVLSEEETTLVSEEESLGLAIDEVSVAIPNLKKDYKLIFISDMHVIVENEEINADMLDTVKWRNEEFRNESGVYSSKHWSQISNTLDFFRADAVLLAGDMIDYASKGNVDCLLDGIRKIQTPVKYIRADHDLATGYSNLKDDYVESLHKKIDSNEEVFSINFKEFLVVGVNNSTSQISKTALEKLQELFQQKLPIILVTHVPLNSIVDNGLYNASKKVWGDRALIWGDNCYYVPNDETKAFLDMVYADNSPVIQVLSGHLHFKHDSALTKSVNQHVFDASFKGTIGLITVTGETEKN